MELEKKHREALLNELEKAKEDLFINKKCLLDKSNENISCLFEISVFLAEKKVELIQDSLVNNEIDF